MTLKTENFTSKFSNIDPLIFQENHQANLFTYGNRTFLLWRDNTDSNYVIKRIDGDCDHPSVMWDIKCDEEGGCFRLYVDLNKDQKNDDFDNEKNEDIVIRILLYNDRKQELIIADLSDFGSMVGEQKKSRLLIKPPGIFGY